ncbi:MAG: tryptophan 2,3-dioxygenase family protein, partial [Pseudobdellovibrio sp.]
MHKNQGPVYYNDYLKLDQFLACQEALSKKYASKENPEVHDETLFIVVHQAYELWFKQILHDLDSVLTTFKKSAVRDNDFSSIIQRLDRIRKIQPLFNMHLDILETMTPMDFLEFRNLLIPASGFQSTQFREIEIKLGLNTIDRQGVDREFFLGRLNQKDRDRLSSLEGEPSLLRLLEKWLERTPFTNKESFNFWSEYKSAVDKILTDDEATISSNIAHLSDKEKQMQLENLRLTKETFHNLFDQEAHAKL